MGRGYENRMYEWWKLRMFQEKITEIGYFIPAVEEDILSEDESEAAVAQLAAGEGQVP